MENKIEWNKLGPEYRRVFKIPVGSRKRWWEFWKKDDGKKAIEELMKQYKQELILGEDGDIFIPTNDSK
jgi:hypothetical protein